MNVVDSSGWLEYFANGPNAAFFADLGLPPAGSVMLAPARAHGAVVWTQDVDFEGAAGVKYTARKYTARKYAAKK